MNKDFEQNSKLLNCVIFENQNGASLFLDPIKIIQTNNADDFHSKIDEIQNAKDNGKYVAGFFSYEGGYLLEPHLQKLLPVSRDVPLLWFGVFDKKQDLTHTEYDAFIDDNIRHDEYLLSPLVAGETPETYDAKQSIIHDAIKNGVFYQTNFTMKLKGKFNGDALALFRDLKKEQNGKYCAFVKTDDFTILSLSPELGFAINDGFIECHPMKGTAELGGAETLRHDVKNRAENLMIVDLMRNDFSRIAKPKSVNVPKLFAIEDYKTLHQMISIVRAELPKNIKIIDILRAVFPLGSITGAPKISAMEMINRLENGARGVYCGSIGYFAPNNDACFNVAIRTPILMGNNIEMGIGSGIVYDSISADEYAECHLKGKFLIEKPGKFSIFETLKWTRDDGFIRASMHIERLLNTAKDLGLMNDLFTPDFFQSELSQLAENITWDAARIKISINPAINSTKDFCTHKIEFFPFQDTKPNWKITISTNRVNSNNPLLYYKTTLRNFYDNEWKIANENGFDEIIFVNENNEITEGSRTNIFIDKGDNILRTPPIHCGLLGGILRRELLQQGKAIEEIITPDDIINARAVYVGNSLRGIKPCNL